MSAKYEHLLSPIKVGNTVFRNRLFAAPTGLHALQGGEQHPTQAIIESFANRARGGAALVTCHGLYAHHQDDGAHLAYDASKAHNRYYLSALSEAIHFYGSKASMEISAHSTGTQSGGKNYYDVVAGLQGIIADSSPSLAMTEEIMNQIADSYAESAWLSKECGFDMCMIHMAYGAPGGARFISPHFNKRTDKYGGSLENRLRFPIMCFDRVKERCGRDFLIEFRVSGEEPQFEDGIRIEDTVAMAKLLEGHVDMLHIHGGEMWAAHCMGFQEAHPFIHAAEAVKRSHTSLAIVTIGGYQNLADSEDVIALGKADIISMGRGWIADPDIGVKAYHDQGADVVPCIKCMRCHDSACFGSGPYVCSVNPEIGLEHQLVSMLRPTSAKKKVAVIGGGPAGMKAALVSAERGHSVTLYEKNAVLGGQLSFADYAGFKVNLRNFKDYLICQLGKSTVEVLTNTEATPDMILAAGYDEIIVAIGARPIIPPIPGVNSNNVVLAPQVFRREGIVPGRIVIIGGGQVGCEAAIHLAQQKCLVTLVEMRAEIAMDASPSYKRELLRNLDIYGVDVRCHLRCTSIGNHVLCEDISGKEVAIAADTIVLAAGMKGCAEDAARFFGTASRTFTVGDCNSAGSVQSAVRSAYGAASQI